MKIKDERKNLTTRNVYKVGNLIDLGYDAYGLVVKSQGCYDLIDPKTGVSWYGGDEKHFKSLDELSSFFHHSGDVEVNATLVVSSNA